MKLRIFAFRDRKLGEYSRPMFFVNQGVMLRELQEVLTAEDKRETFQKHPEDFELCALGEFDSESGVFDAVSPIIVMMLSDLLVKSN